MLVGCAMYTDLLKAPSLLSLSLQVDDMDTVQGIKSILKPSTSLELLSKESPKEWPTVKLLLFRIENESTESDKVYQGATLSRFKDELGSRCADLDMQNLQRLGETFKDLVRPSSSI